MVLYFSFFCFFIMGAENSILESCEWGASIPTSSDADWSLRVATLQDDTVVTVFQHKKKDKKEVDLLKRASNNLRTLRHPNLLRFIGSGENSEGSYLVTEHVLPLEGALKSLSSLEICAGLHSVLDALVFLHDRVGVSHNNVCLSSVYVTQDGSWRLGGLEHSCKFQEATSEFLDKCLVFRNEETISPEEKQGNIETSIEYGHARDVFAFGCFCKQLLERLEDLGDVTKTFELRIQDECLNADPQKRPHLQTLLGDTLFRHDFLDIFSFLKNITTKTEDEKTNIFSSLTPKLLALPEELVAKRLVVPLLSRFVMLDHTANNFMVPHLLTPYRGQKRPKSGNSGEVTPILHAELFKTHVIPELYKIFHIRDIHIRLVLLTYFSAYVDLFDKETLEETIFIQLLLGLRDSDDRLVAASLRGLADLIPLLGGDMVIGGTRKKFFKEGMPRFKNKSTEEKGPILKNLSGVIGKKMLLKDLAALSSNGSVVSGTDEKERRNREKEQRREEARQRREERKRKLQEKQMREQNKRNISPPKLQTVIEEDITPTVCDTKVNDVKFADLQQEIMEKENQEVEEEKGDWSDWDDTSKKDDFDPDVNENDLSDEIENELKNMPSTIPLSPKNKDADSSVPSVDWTDAPTNQNTFRSSQSRVKGALKLGGQSKSKKSEKQSKRDNKLYKVDNWDQQWDNISETINSRTEKDKGVIHIPPVSSPRDMLRIKTLSVSDSLGSEFDVKSISVKPKPELGGMETDFFADMMPNIKVKPKAPLITSAENKSKSPTKKQSITFAVVNSAEPEDNSGWGDDLDWGSEDF